MLKYAGPRLISDCIQELAEHAASILRCKYICSNMYRWVYYLIIGWNCESNSEWDSRHNGHGDAFKLRTGFQPELNRVEFRFFSSRLWCRNQIETPKIPSKKGINFIQIKEWVFLLVNCSFKSAQIAQDVVQLHYFGSIENLFGGYPSPYSVVDKA